jgi:multidrug efflux system outer membrane protein
VLVAFQETTDALSDIAFLRDRGTHLHDAVVNSTQAAAISRARYDRGQANYFEVVDSERAALANQRAEIQNDQLRLFAAVALIKALGGGWAPGDEVPATPRELAPGHLPSLPTSVEVP